MHNDAMTSRCLPRGVQGLLALCLAGSLALSGCSGDDSKEPASSGSDSSTTEATGTSSPTPSETPYLPVPAGVVLTDQGSALKVGDKATVAYEPRQKQVGVLAITVTRLEKVSFAQQFKGWKVDAETKTYAPYFVHAKVKNVGDTDLGGRDVPLYIVDGTNTLNEAWTFKSTFAPCPSAPFPKKFAKGDKVNACLVYLVPNKGDLTAVSFRPTQEFDPITWTGKLETPPAPKPTKKKGATQR